MILEKQKIPNAEGKDRVNRIECPPPYRHPFISPTKLGGLQISHAVSGIGFFFLLKNIPDDCLIEIFSNKSNIGREME
jgi:hypothetical protein